MDKLRIEDGAPRLIASISELPAKSGASGARTLNDSYKM
jgi:hypothetical protein